MRLLPGLFVLGLVATAGVSMADDDCVVLAGAAACALDEGSRVYSHNGVYTNDRWNTLASASTAGGPSGASAYLGQTHHDDAWVYCNWGCTRSGNLRDATGLNVSQSDPATSGWVFVGQEEGWAYYTSSSRTTFWEYHTTGAMASRTVAGTTVEAGATQTSWRGYAPGVPYATGCSTGAYARVNGQAPAAAPGAPCAVGPVDTQVPQLYSHCRNTAAGRVCGKLPDWPDGTGLPFL